MLDADADADADAANATAIAPPTPRPKLRCRCGGGGCGASFFRRDAQEPILLFIINYLLYKWSIALPNNTCHNPTPHTLE